MEDDWDWENFRVFDFNSGLSFSTIITWSILGGLTVLGTSLSTNHRLVDSLDRLRAKRNSYSLGTFISVSAMSFAFIQYPYLYGCLYMFNIIDNTNYLVLSQI